LNKLALARAFNTHRSDIQNDFKKLGTFVAPAVYESA
jgi:hypothetical protein